jgi:hypothetical protein
MEDFDHGLRQVVRFRKFEEGGSSMEDQDRETRIDEDVEGHAHKNRNISKDEETNDDVEGHSHFGSHKAAPHKGREDDGDDVEGHMHKAAPHKGMNKA